MTKDHKSSKQYTLDKLPEPTPKDAIEIIKQHQDKIMITSMETTTKEDELILKITFKLPPEKTFSKVQSNLWFDRQPINSVLIRMLQGPLATVESEFSAALDMKGITPGEHVIGVEMFGLWDVDEQLSRTIKEISVKYVPQTRQDRLVKIPSIRSVAGADLAVVSNSEKTIYEEIEGNIKKEQLSKRDEW